MCAKLSIYFKDKAYYVPNLVTDSEKGRTKYVFICESPHKNEVLEKTPLVGSAGRSAARFLELDYSTLGEAIKQTNHKYVGIINVCPYPLQHITIDCKEKGLHKDSKNGYYRKTKFDKHMKLVRQGHNSLKNHRDNNINEFESCILKSLKKQINKIIECNPSVCFIVCGAFAKSYFNACEMDEPVYIPHPARNKWAKIDKRSKEYKVLCEVKKFLKD